MSIFSTNYDNSIVSVDTAWSPSANPVLNVKFARGPFSMDYHCLQSRFMRSFKEDFTEFYEKVMKDYDEVTGRSNTLESCFDAMIECMTEIDYRPEPKLINIDFKLDEPVTNRQLMYDEFTKRYFWCDSTKVEKLVDEAIRKSIVEDE